jgi:hypothetical protein
MNANLIPAAPAELHIQRDADRVHYLTSKATWGVEHHIAFKPGATFGVMRFTKADDNGHPVLKIDSGAFTFFHSLSAQQARLLALALNVAADEAEAAAAQKPSDEEDHGVFVVEIGAAA